MAENDPDVPPCDLESETAGPTFQRVPNFRRRSYMSKEADSAAAAGKPFKVLEENVQQAAKLLQQLRFRADGWRPPQLPKQDLLHAAGIAFLFTSKGGLGVSVEIGHGFVVSQLSFGSAVAPRLLEETSWSAPLFISANATSVGMSMGYRTAAYVVILHSRDAVQSFLQPQTVRDMTLGAATQIGEQQQQPTNTENRYKIFHFEQGLMLDVGVMFAHLGADEQLNLLYYGEGVSSAAILAGHVRAPPQADILYDVLKGRDGNN